MNTFRARNRWTTGALLLFIFWLTSCATAPKAKDYLTLEQMFLRAGARGSVTELDAGLQSGVNIDAAGAGGATALMSAAFRGHTEAVRWLIAKGALLETRDEIGQTALHHAALSKQAGPLAELLTAGANANVQSAPGLTPLMLATRHGSEESVLRLLASGADVQMREPGGWTALTYSIPRGSDAIFFALLKEFKTSDLMFQDDEGSTLLHICALYNRRKYYDALKAAGIPEDIKNKAGMTALEYAKFLKAKDF